MFDADAEDNTIEELPISSLARTVHVEESMNMSFKVPPQLGMDSIHESASSQGLIRANSTTPDVTIQVSGNYLANKYSLLHA